MRKSLIFIALTIFAATLFIDNLSAQNRQMLLFEIDGNRYQRCNYNKEGELQSFEKLIIGSIVEKAKSYRLPVEIYSYNAEGQLKDSTRIKVGDGFLQSAPSLIFLVINAWLSFSFYSQLRVTDIITAAL
jgi:hypothetical protein